MDKKSILMIDDDPNIHTFSRIILEKAGYRFLSAFDGSQGLKMILQYKPDLVLLDYMMPQLNGFQVYQEIASNKLYESCRDIPVVILTAFENNSENKDLLLKMGLSAYLYKPFGSKELINVIENILYTNQIKVKNKQLFSAIKEARDFLENLIESSPDAIITTDQTGRITFFSRGGEEIFGHQAPTVLGAPLDQYCVPQEKIKEILTRLETVGNIKNVEMEFRNNKGSLIPVSFSFSVIKDKKDQLLGFLALGKDISELKRLEKERIEKERLATLMKAAAAINHEINNPLTPILGNIQLMLAEKNTLADWVVDKLRIIETNAWKVHRIVQKLARITQPVTTTYCGGIEMLDIEKSK